MSEEARRGSVCPHPGPLPEGEGVKPAINRWPGRLGQVGLYALLLAYQLNATVAYIGLALAVLASLLQARDWLPSLRRDPVPKLALALALYIGLYGLWAAREFPATAAEQQSAALAWLYGLLFPPVAWQIRQHRKQLDWLLSALAAGVLLRIMLHADWRHLAGIFHWPRTGFGLVETVFAPLAGMTALAWLLLAPRLAVRWRGLGVGLGIVGGAVLLEAVVLAQTRSVWLAGALVFPAALWLRYGGCLKSHVLKSTQGRAGLALLALFAAGFFYLNSAALHSRLEARLSSSPAGQNVAEAAAKSANYRLEMWRLGLEKWQDRPVFGWGPGTTEWLMLQSGAKLVEPDGGKAYYHLHSHYVEILLRFGLVGAALFTALPLLLAWGVWQARAAARIAPDYAIFLLAGWGFAAVVVFFDFQLFKFAWRNGCLIWLALNHAVCLQNLDPNNPQDEDA